MVLIAAAIVPFIDIDSYENTNIFKGFEYSPLSNLTTKCLRNFTKNPLCSFGGLSGKILAPGRSANPSLADPAAFSTAASALI